MGIDVSLLARPGDRDGARRAGSPRATRGSSSAARSARAGATGRDKVCVEATPGGFGLWAEQLLAESTGKEGKGLDPRARRAGRRPRPPGAGGAAERPIRARPGVLPLGVRDRGRRLDPRDQPVRPARRAGGEGQDERGARAGGESSSSRGLGGRAVRAGDEPATTSASRRSSTRRPRATSAIARARRRARATRPAASSRTASGPRYLHSTGQLHKGGPEHGRLPAGGRRHGRGAGDPRASRSASAS